MSGAVVSVPPLRPVRLSAGAGSRSRWMRRWAPRWVAAVLVLVGVVGASVACSGSSSEPTTAPSLGEVRAMLREHASALRQHDRARFLAGVSSADQAALFRQQQSDEYDNLIKVPLTTWSYEVVGAETDRQLIRAATTKYGRDALVVHVSVRYGLRSADPVPTSRDVYWTFVRQGGAAVAIGDTDAESLGATSWHGPWDFGPLSVARGRYGIVFGHPGYEAVLDVVLRDVDAAVPAVSAVWGEGWPQYVAVVVTASTAEFAANTGGGSSNDSVAALAVNDGRDAVHETAIGRRLLISPGELERLSPTGRAVLLRHEITHIATADITTEATPSWLTEGFADYVGNLHSGQSVATVAAELARAVRRGAVPAQLPTDAEFTGGQAAAAQAYEGAWLACRLIAVKVGQAGLVRFYRVVGRQLDVASTAAATGLRAVLHESVATFTRQWRAYLRQQLG